VSSERQKRLIVLSMSSFAFSLDDRACARA
jgi:KaiC/GvpD/RAD55 family RecA-like ATPase